MPEACVWCIQARGNTGCVGLLFEKVKNCTARDFTLYHSSGFAVYEPFGQNNTFRCVSAPTHCHPCPCHVLFVLQIPHPAEINNP